MLIHLHRSGSCEKTVSQFEWGCFYFVLLSLSRWVRTRNSWFFCHTFRLVRPVSIHILARFWRGRMLRKPQQTSGVRGRVARTHQYSFSVRYTPLFTLLSEILLIQTPFWRLFCWWTQQAWLSLQLYISKWDPKPCHEYAHGSPWSFWHAACGPGRRQSPLSLIS